MPKSGVVPFLTGRIGGWFLVSQLALRLSSFSLCLAWKLLFSWYFAQDPFWSPYYRFGSKSAISTWNLTPRFRQHAEWKICHLGQKWCLLFRHEDLLRYPWSYRWWAWSHDRAKYPWSKPEKRSILASKSFLPCALVIASWRTLSFSSCGPSPLLAELACFSAVFVGVCPLCSLGHASPLWTQPSSGSSTHQRNSYCYFRILGPHSY